jgi:hypothetical protein
MSGLKKEHRLLSCGALQSDNTGMSRAVDRRLAARLRVRAAGAERGSMGPAVLAPRW